MPEVSTFRLYIMRATYLLLLVGLGATIWPGIFHHTETTPLSDGVVSALLGAVAILAAVGTRYPLKMLPLLLFELAWKTIWLLAFALPMWISHRIDADAWETIKACLMGIVIFPIAIPWPYVIGTYVKSLGDRWR